MANEHLERGNKNVVNTNDERAQGTHGGAGKTKAKQADRSMTSPPLKTSGGVPTQAPQPSRPNRGADGRDEDANEARPSVAPAGTRPSGSNAAGFGKSTPDIDATTGSDTADDVITAGNKFPQTAAADKGPVAAASGDEGGDDEGEEEGDVEDGTAGDDIDTADARSSSGVTKGPDKNLF